MSAHVKNRTDVVLKTSIVPCSKINCTYPSIRTTVLRPTLSLLTVREQFEYWTPLA